MQKTYCTVINNLEKDSSAMLDALAKYYGEVKRQLYRQVAKHGGNCKKYKTDFCAKYDITARQINAIAIDLQGQIDATKKLLKLEKKRLTKSIKSKKARFKRDKAKMEEVEAGNTCIE